MSNLRLSYLADADDALTAGCCPGQFYAMLFDPSGQTALKLVTTSPDLWQLETFVHSQQTSFAIPLTEDAAGRSFFYTNDLVDGEFVLAMEELPYSVEYWKRDDQGVAHNRDNDTLIMEDDLYWNGTDKVGIVLPQSEVIRIQSTEPVAQVAYDSVEASITAIIYMLSGGVVTPGSTYAALQIYDSDGVIIGGQSTTDVIPNLPGAFKIVMPAIVLQADSVYGMVVTVRLAGVDYTSIVPVVVYD